MATDLWKNREMFGPAFLFTSYIRMLYYILYNIVQCELF